jgi:chromate reductase
MATRKIAVLVGSLRKESFTRKLAKNLMLLAPPTLELDIVEIRDLQMASCSARPSTTARCRPR